MPVCVMASALYIAVGLVVFGVFVALGVLEDKLTHQRGVDWIGVIGRAAVAGALWPGYLREILLKR